MPRIELRGLVKRFGRTVAVADLSAVIEDREFFVVVGPTACGKTTLLKLIAGLLKPDAGEVLFDGVCMNDVPPRERRVRMVFQGQDYALFPHLVVYDERRLSNLSFPLRIRKGSLGGIQERVRRVAERLRIGRDLFPRKPVELSEGQKQRVALGKAVVLPPQVLLLDEPLSHLDPHARAQARDEIRRLHEELGTTTVHVTHDLTEAFLLADRMAVMREGRFEQVGTPREIRDHPANTFVSEFVEAYRRSLRDAFGP
ncbi:ABC transporter ATP-binding protein [Candidatus Bipolaricaulota bacterium]|nr:ABC transporter ATP-binding protein [Candidatus Bipolaricaulota bacterium]